MAIGAIGGIMPAPSVGGIAALGPIQPTQPTQPMQISGVSGNGADASAGVSFGQYLTEALGQVNSLQQESTSLTNDFIAGKTDSIHEVLIAGEKASLSLQFALEIRNKVLEAYQEINRMQI